MGMNFSKIPGKQNQNKNIPMFFKEEAGFCPVRKSSVLLMVLNLVPEFTAFNNSR